MATHVLGNTRASPCSAKSRAFQFTLQKIERYEYLRDLLCNLKSMDYLISCIEKAPTTGKEHIHIYVHFKSPYKLSKKILGVNAHIETCKGSPKQNIDYIRKDGDILDEIGEPPKQGHRYTVKELRELDNSDDLEDWRAYNTYTKIKNAPRPIRLDEVYKEDLKVFYITGESGAGKSRKAFEIVKEHGYEEFDMIKYENGFYNGVSGKTNCAIYDEFRPSSMKAADFIELIDYNIHPMNIKGGSKMNKYKLIIITSIFHPEDIYSCLPEESKVQWLRRMNIVNI